MKKILRVMKRPFNILGVQQIAIGHQNKSALQKLWVDLLGLPVVGTFQSEKENVDEDILSAGKGPTAVEIDIMTPLDEQKKPRVDIPALNHIGLWVDNLALAVDWLTKEGVRMASGGIRKGASGYDVTFLHPKGSDEFPFSGEGVLIELVQAPDSVISHFQEQT